MIMNVRLKRFIDSLIHAGTLILTASYLTCLVVCFVMYLLLCTGLLSQQKQKSDAQLTATENTIQELNMKVNVLEEELFKVNEQLMYAQYTHANGLDREKNDKDALVQALIQLKQERKQEEAEHKKRVVELNLKQSELQVLEINLTSEIETQKQVSENLRAEVRQLAGQLSSVNQELQIALQRHLSIESDLKQQLNEKNKVLAAMEQAHLELRQTAESKLAELEQELQQSRALLVDKDGELMRVQSQLHEALEANALQLSSSTATSSSSSYSNQRLSGRVSLTNENVAPPESPMKQQHHGSSSSQTPSSSLSIVKTTPKSTKKPVMKTGVLSSSTSNVINGTPIKSTALSSSISSASKLRVKEAVAKPRSNVGNSSN
jgi:hypothetical protein